MNMNWCFAKINGRLAELFFEKNGNEPKVIGHAYVSVTKYTAKRELKLVEKDTAHYQLSYRNKVYRDKIRNKVLQSSSLYK